MKNVLHPSLEANVTWLQQAAELLEEISDREYSTSPKGWEPHRASGHLRHILEFYQCFLEGLPSGLIDYDARRRDVSIEKSRAAALLAITQIVRTLETASFPLNRELLVRMEDAPSPSSQFLFRSTVARELQVLSSHTIHHFALLALTLRGHGVVLDSNFGMAPSTLRYQKLQREAA